LQLSDPITESIEAGAIISGLSLIKNAVVAEAVEDVENWRNHDQTQISKISRVRSPRELTRLLYDGCKYTPFMSLSVVSFLISTSSFIFVDCVFYGEVTTGINNYSYI